MDIIHTKDVHVEDIKGYTSRLGDMQVPAGTEVALDKLLNEIWFHKDEVPETVKVFAGVLTELVYGKDHANTEMGYWQ